MMATLLERTLSTGMTTNRRFEIIFEDENGRRYPVEVIAENRFKAVWDYYRSIGGGRYNSVIKGNYPIVYSVTEY